MVPDIAVLHCCFAVMQIPDDANGNYMCMNVRENPCEFQSGHFHYGRMATYQIPIQSRTTKESVSGVI